MSIAAMNWAWRQELAPTPKLVLLSLADAADDHGVCWPSVPTVARKCRISPRTVRRIILELVVLGLLLTEARFRQNGSCTSNRYVLAIAGGDKLSGAPVTDDSVPGHPCQGPGDTHDSPRTTNRTVTESPPPQDAASSSLAPVIAKSPASGGGDSDTYDLVYPKGLNDSERLGVTKLMDELPSELAQQLLDELAGRMEARTIHTSPLAYLRGLVTRASAGTFTPEMALRIADRRKRQRQTEAALRQNDTRHGQALQHAAITAHLAKDNPLVKRLMAIQEWAKQRNTKEE